MNWVLIAVLVTSNGVTELRSNHVTIEECQAAEQELHQVWSLPTREGFGELVVLQTECEYVGEPR